MKRAAALLVMLLLASCKYVEHTREVGHKGKARVNPYLAAQMFLQEYDYEISANPGWPDLDGGELRTVFIPASVLASEGHIRDLEYWIGDGGHAVIFLENGETYRDDWSSGSIWSMFDYEENGPLQEWLTGLGIELKYHSSDSTDASDADSVVLDEVTHEVWMEARTAISSDYSEEESVLFESLEIGDGRLTLMSDARPFRNRYFGNYDHAALLLDLVDTPTYYGRQVAFVRTASTSFLAMLWSWGWPALIALISLIVFWLWKNLPRFGPVDSHEDLTELRSYDHHLEALGAFHWRLDRAEGLLQPLREGLVERTQALALASGRKGADLFEIMAERAGISRERAERAMTFSRARDGASFTRLIADLQLIHRAIP